jgi:hypothetical protein
MKVSFVKVQKFISASVQSYKLFYLVDDSKKDQKFDVDDGSATMTVCGSKQMEIKMTPEGFSMIESAFDNKKVKQGDMVDILMEPNPNNPSINICTGYKAF